MDKRTQSSRSRRRAAGDPHDRLTAVVSGCFPDDARILSIPRQADPVFIISWRLHTDPLRPEKRSKTIRLTLSSDLLELYGPASEENRELADRHIRDILREELLSFDPDHSHPAGKDAPMVTWTLGSG